MIPRKIDSPDPGSGPFTDLENDPGILIPATLFQSHGSPDAPLTPVLLLDGKTRLPIPHRNHGKAWMQTSKFVQVSTLHVMGIFINDLLYARRIFAHQVVEYDIAFRSDYFDPDLHRSKYLRLHHSPNIRIDHVVIISS